MVRKPKRGTKAKAEKLTVLYHPSGLREGKMSAEALARICRDGAVISTVNGRDFRCLCAECFCAILDGDQCARSEQGDLCESCVETKARNLTDRNLLEMLARREINIEGDYFNSCVCAKDHPKGHSFNPRDKESEAIDAMRNAARDQVLCQMKMA